MCTESWRVRPVSTTWLCPLNTWLVRVRTRPLIYYRLLFPACPTNLIDVAKAELEIHVYQPIETEAAEMTTGKDGDDVIAATVTDLPCIEWDILWDRYD